MLTALFITVKKEKHPKCPSVGKWIDKIRYVHTTEWEDPLEKGMASYSSILAWRIPWTEETGKLQSMGSQRVGHN